jgi:hypothetical protein
VKKLNLDPETLRVERFEVEPEAAASDGTVVANQLPGTWRSCGPNTCYPQASCDTGSPCFRCIG